MQAPSQFRLPGPGRDWDGGRARRCDFGGSAAWLRFLGGDGNWETVGSSFLSRFEIRGQRGQQMDLGSGAARALEQRQQAVEHWSRCEGRREQWSTGAAAASGQQVEQQVDGLDAAAAADSPVCVGCGTAVGGALACGHWADWRREEGGGGRRRTWLWRLAAPGRDGVWAQVAGRDGVWRLGAGPLRPTNDMRIERP